MTEQISNLRRLIDEPTPETYSDTALSARIDEVPDIRILAGTIWREKAATYAGLIDVKEGNSDRKMSQLHKQALVMAESLSAADAADLIGARRPGRTRAIERP